MIKRVYINKYSEVTRDKIMCFLHYRYAHSKNTIFTEEKLSGITLDIKPRILHFALESLEINPLANIEMLEEEGKPEDREQRLAELGAGKKLFESARVSVSAVEAVLQKILA